MYQQLLYSYHYCCLDFFLIASINLLCVRYFCDMPPKGKKSGRGQTISLSEFTGTKPAGGELDWAEDVWEPEGQEQERDVAGYQRQLHANRYKHDGTKLGTQAGFREAPAERLASMVPLDMPPPYVAHFNGLADGITEGDIRGEFLDDVVARVKIVTLKRQGDSERKTTFAFVEFTTIAALQAAVLLTGKNIKGRRVRVDVATPEQIERLNREGEARDPREKFDREAFGAQQSQGVRTTELFGDFRNGSQAQPSAEPFGGRSAMGNSVPRRNDRRQPDTPTSGDGLANLGNWRSEGPVAQPERQNSSPEPDGASPNSEGSARRFPPSSGAGGGRFGSGRPQRPAAAPNADNASRWEALGR